MTLEQLKERIERTLQKNNIDYIQVTTMIIFLNEVYCSIITPNKRNIALWMPSCDLLIEAVDLECRAIKARQSKATNGIDL